MNQDYENHYELQEQVLHFDVSKVKKLLGVLFWLVIPRTLASVLGQDTFTAQLPMLGTVGALLGNACSLIYGLVLLQLAFASDRYRYAGMLSLAALAVNLVMLFLPASVLTTLLVFAVMGATLATDYFEFHGHGEILEGIDDVLADKFRLLWKWDLAATGAVVGGLLLMVISPFFGIVLVLTGASGSLVVMVKKLLYLYRIWKVFRNYN